MICGIYMVSFKNLMFAKWNDNLKRLHCYMPTIGLMHQSLWSPAPINPKEKLF